MALYRWSKSSIVYAEQTTTAVDPLSYSGTGYYYSGDKILNQNGTYTLTYFDDTQYSSGNGSSNFYSGRTSNPSTIYRGQSGAKIYNDGNTVSFKGTYTVYKAVKSKGTFIEYVYSDNPSQYPNGGAAGSYWYSDRFTYNYPDLIVPGIAMQGKPITVNWTAGDSSFNNYILERKADVDEDWIQVYSGPALTFTENVGTWNSVQYRIKAGADGIYGGYTTSSSVNVVTESAIAISGSDGDLGNITSDVTYSVLSDGTSDLTVTETVNGMEIRTFTATNGATNKIPVVDLPTGYGTISVTASTNPGSGVVSVTRDWTYSKTAITFPDAGGVADLSQQGQTIWAKTIAEAVRTPGIWGGNLMLALQKLTDVVLYKGGNNFCDIFNKSIPLVTSSQISSYGKIQTGTYTGTGAYGSTNPTSLTFNFTPKLVLIFDTTGLFSQPQNGQTYYVSYGMILWAPGISKDIVSSYPDKYRYYTLTGNKFSWYADGPNANYQLNDKKTYRWVAFG